MKKIPSGRIFSAIEKEGENVRKVYCFHASWCAPCKYVAAHIMPDIIKACPNQVEAVDVNARPTFTQRCGVKSLPTILLMENDKVFGKFVGREVPKEKIIDWLKGDNDDTNKSD